MMRLGPDFFQQSALDMAPQLLGKQLVRRFDPKTIRSYMITETEAYMGEEDLACHASKGRTTRTEIMYARGGFVYVYLIYGVYWMLNVVSGGNEQPQAVLIRGLETINGPGRLTKQLLIDQTFYGEDLLSSPRIWIEDSELKPEFLRTPRIGIDYAGKWKDRPWRFLLPG